MRDVVSCLTEHWERSTIQDQYEHAGLFQPYLDVCCGTIWQTTVCHAGELAEGVCATGQASVTPLMGPAQVREETDGPAHYCNSGQGEVRSATQGEVEWANLCHNPRWAALTGTRTRFWPYVWVLSTVYLLYLWIGLLFKLQSITDFKHIDINSHQ